MSRASRRSNRWTWPIVACLAAVAIGSAAERTHPLDCLPDRAVAWEAAEPNPETRFGAGLLPGIVLGPPGDSLAFQGALTVASFGFGGRATLGFDDILIEDRPGPDFIVFENAFFRLPLPASPRDDFEIFAEPATVEVSADGEQWLAFPYDAQALADVGGDDLDKAGYLSLTGLAGLTPTLTGNWTEPNDPAVFDPAGTGGISGAGGDAFDLADVGLSEARFVRITDADTQAGFPGTAEGFDLDAVVVLHGRPLPPSASDRDGDRLSDLEEELRYGSDPDAADSDGDGTDDGREVAGCRDPQSFDLAPWLQREPRLWVVGNACSELRWTFMGSGRLYDLIRGDLAALAETASVVDLGIVDCLEDDILEVRWSCDAGIPPASEAYFYLVRVDGQPDFGRSSALLTREAVIDCP